MKELEMKKRAISNYEYIVNKISSKDDKLIKNTDSNIAYGMLLLMKSLDLINKNEYENLLKKLNEKMEEK